jgi:hypothetical protein
MARMAYYRCDSCRQINRIEDPPTFFWCTCGQILDCTALLALPSDPATRASAQRFRRDAREVSLAGRRFARLG